MADVGENWEVASGTEAALIAPMAFLNRHHLLRHKLQTRPALVLGVFAAFLSYASAGCLSNEYVIPKQELVRLAQTPPEVRGARVLVVQNVGDRRGEAVQPGAPVQPGQPYPDGSYAGPVVVDSDPALHLGVAVAINSGPHHHHHMGAPAPGHASFRGSPGGAAPVPPPRPAGGSAVSTTSPRGGGSHGSIGKGGSDDLAAIAVIAVAVAVLLAVSFAATEGARYDGAVQLSPWQPVHLKMPGQGEQVVALGDLQPDQAVAAERATVMDDEGWGLNRLERRPLDRKGMAFKVDLGSLQNLCGCYSETGVGSHIQIGYFPHHRFGILGSLSLGGGTDDQDNTFTRHSINMEAQWFPLNLWRLHFGGFGHVGQQFASDVVGGDRNGLALGAGGIIELALTTRLALMFRGDWTSAQIGRAPDGGAAWNSSTMWTGGLAIY